MSKRSPKTTLGDLQGDQSKVQLHKSPSFIVSQGSKRSTEFHVAVHNYGLIRIKGKSWSPHERLEFRVDMGRRLSIKTSPD
jgi:hypothetical protein